MTCRPLILLSCLVLAACASQPSASWRREPDGHWKVIFDDGACRCTGRKAAD